MKQELLQELLDQYLDGTLTEAGKAQLAALADDPSCRPALESLLAQTFQEGVFTGEEDPRVKAAVKGWLHGKIKRHTTIIRFARLAAAACILGLAGTAAWLYTAKPKPAASGQIVQATAPADISPGREGAVLTLAGGRQIVLDSAVNGALAQQGSAAVQKKDGQVSYTATASFPAAEAPVYNTISTPRGYQYTVVLADGSKVLLNAASSIRFPVAFTGKERVVEITGEAYFEVAKDPARKFMVMAGNMKTEVLGTHFTINSYSDEERLTATLLEGSIRVSAGDKTTVLHPGGQAQLGQDGNLATVAQANLEEATGWINGYFYFEKADVHTVMRQLARWYDIDVIYKGNISRELFGGKIQRNLRLSAVMDILKTIGIRYTMEGKTLIVGS